MSTNSNPKWAEEKQALKKIQMHFTFTVHASMQLKLEAVKANLTTTNYVRKLIGLKYEPITRDRIGLSLSDEDFKKLAERYSIETNHKEIIKHKVTEEINIKYQNQIAHNDRHNE